MNVDRAVFALAGTMVLVSLALAWARQPLLAAARSLCRCQYAASRIHRLLPGRHDLQQARLEARAGICVLGRHTLIGSHCFSHVRGGSGKACGQSRYF